MKKNYSFRNLINDIHLWIGVPSALVLVIMCMSGTLYVFQREITQWADHDRFYLQIPEGKTTLSADSLKLLVENQMKGKVTTIQIPQESDQAWTFTVVHQEDKGLRTKEKPTKTDPTEKSSKKNKEGKPEKKVADKEKAKSYLINPYSGLIQGDAKTPSVGFFAKVLQLHRWLLIENKDIGGAITGTACILMLFLQITGFILWLPAKLSSWKKWHAWEIGFKIKMDASWRRINFDLHKSLGFYAFLFVTIMATTGPYFAFKWYKEGTQALLDAKPFAKENTVLSEIQDRESLALNRIISHTYTIYPYAGNVRINLPKDEKGSYAVQKYQEGFFACSGIDRVILDQYSGAILELKPYADLSFGQKVIFSAKAIHTGEIFGTFTKLLYFLACLIATSLPITGVLIWLRKGKKEKKKPVTASATHPLQTSMGKNL
ncbi:PepSY-associated TM helix domain-containing protein [Xanthocytophaga flava]|uniref:PepSY-associated TM helix domain-containing protein n=1 Tax=Xanthocytophaga flava TaxID=3048013 RepID=UPI0028D8A136|nr:PepSY-associated TM helix domain-containing protein [Xanthocytophaga flavus]MDJ1470326.1 PepSY-associated TM helix domain-containing protein [Xanthocytophaga flavus]